MRMVIQRVSQATVTVDHQVVGQISAGLVVLLGVARGDTEQQADWLADKVMGLRIFEDAAGKMNRSVLDIGGELLIVSQFTLLADCRKGRRPGFSDAAPPDEAERLYHYVVNSLRQRGCAVATGQFQARMQVALCNDGPVTLVLDSQGAGSREQGAGSREQGAGSREQGAGSREPGACILNSGIICAFGNLPLALSAGGGDASSPLEAALKVIMNVNRESRWDV
jgi:D-aminoacyl-tRNA deacylase